MSDCPRGDQARVGLISHPSSKCHFETGGAWVGCRYSEGKSSVDDGRRPSSSDASVMTQMRSPLRVT